MPKEPPRLLVKVMARELGAGRSRQRLRRPSDSHQITQALLACRRGDEDAFRQLLPLVYSDLRRIAHRQLQRERPGPTLNTTALIHEAYLKLVDHTQVEWHDRSHFLAVSARAMRQIIVDYAKKKRTTKHGGNTVRVELDEAQLGVSQQAEMLLALDQALSHLATFDARLVRVVECRFFAGYSERETMKVLGVPLRTVQRDWMRARIWLKAEMERSPAQERSTHDHEN